MSKKKLLLLSGLFLFLLFVAFSFVVHKNVLKSFDFNTTVHLQDNISRRWDGMFSFLSDFGQFEAMTVVLLVIFVVARKWKGGFMGLVFFAGFHFFEIFGKYFVNHPPPPEFMIRTQKVFNFPQFTVRSDFSYPSGHAARALFVSSVLLILIWQNKRLSQPVKLVISGLLVVYDIVMLVSRVTLGEHWTTDVIGGSLLGLSFGLFAGIFLVDKTKITRLPFFPKYKIEIKKVE